MIYMFIREFSKVVVSMNSAQLWIWRNALINQNITGNENCVGLISKIISLLYDLISHLFLHETV